MNCNKILKISQHTENQNEVGKRGKGREDENLVRPARLLMPEKLEGLLPWTTAEEGLRRVSVSHLCKGLSPDLDLWNIIAPKVITACLEAILSQLGLCSWASRLMWTKAKSYCQCIATQNDTRSAVMKSALDVLLFLFSLKSFIIYFISISLSPRTGKKSYRDRSFCLYPRLNSAFVCTGILRLQ